MAPRQAGQALEGSQSGGTLEDGPRGGCGLRQSCLPPDPRSVDTEQLERSHSRAPRVGGPWKDSREGGGPHSSSLRESGMDGQAEVSTPSRLTTQPGERRMTSPLLPARFLALSTVGPSVTASPTAHHLVAIWSSPLSGAPRIATQHRSRRHASVPQPWRRPHTQSGGARRCCSNPL